MISNGAPAGLNTNDNDSLIQQLASRTRELIYKDEDRRNHHLKRDSRGSSCGSLKGTVYLLSLLFTTLIAISSLPNLSEAFNVDTQSAIVHQGPAGSFFGYTVASHKDRGAYWLLVGAPKARTDQPSVKEPGAVYRCSTNSNKACQQIPFDVNGSSVIQLRNETKQSDDKSYQWFGASLSSATENGSIIACAPKYVYYSTNLKRRDPVGTCWVSRGSFAGFLEYSPCRINGKLRSASLIVGHNPIFSPLN